ncbi:hypothetical protein LINPERHAP2_LOCUS23236, partial [Linum perenne]
MMKLKLIFKGCRCFYFSLSLVNNVFFRGLLDLESRSEEEEGDCW